MNNYEGIQIIESILAIEGNLGMKLEALRILPQLTNPRTYKEISRIVQISIENVDIEVIRNGLLIIQHLPPNFASRSLINALIEKLNAQDTDIQYHAIFSLLHLQGQILPKKLCFCIQPLTEHPNKILRAAAREAVQMLAASKDNKK